MGLHNAPGITADGVGALLTNITVAHVELVACPKVTGADCRRLLPLFPRPGLDIICSAR